MKKNKKKLGKKGRITLFGKVLISVLVLGGTVLVILSMLGQDKELVVRQFFQLPQFEVSVSEEDENLGVEENENERIYEEILKYTSRVKMVECKDTDVVKILIGGDVLLDDKYATMASYKNKGNVIENAFSQDLLTYMRDADIFMVNNEFTFSERGMPTKGKKFTFRANPRDVNFYHEMGVDVVSLANNHAYDFGEISLLDTMETLSNADIAYVGAGRNLEEAMCPYFFVANGVKIGVVATTQIERMEIPDTKEATEHACGVLRCLEPEKALQAIEIAKEYADVVVLYVHWGTESQQEVDWWQEEQARVFAASGVDAIIGNHPHCLQKIEYVNDVPVIYSLGNFWFNSKTVETGVIELVVSKEGIDSLRFVPCLQSECKTVMLQGGEKQGVLNTLRMISLNVKIDEDGYISESS